MAEETRDLASVIGDALNVVRSALAHVNIDLPMVLAQVLALAIAVIVFIAWWKTARRGPGKWKKYAARITLAIAGIVGIGILYAWFDYGRQPLMRQMVAQLTADPPAEPQAELIDYAGNVVSSGASIYDGATRELLLSYEPQFADPPRLRLRIAGCDTLELRPARAHLRSGAAMPIAPKCEGTT
jgi:hypothetical protein